MASVFSALSISPVTPPSMICCTPVFIEFLPKTSTYALFSPRGRSSSFFLRKGIFPVLFQLSRPDPGLDKVVIGIGPDPSRALAGARSEEHTSELQSRQ